MYVAKGEWDILPFWAVHVAELDDNDMLPLHLHSNGRQLQNKIISWLVSMVSCSLNQLPDDHHHPVRVYLAVEPVRSLSIRGAGSLACAACAALHAYRYRPNY